MTTLNPQGDLERLEVEYNRYMSGPGIKDLHEDFMAECAIIREQFAGNDRYIREQIFAIKKRPKYRKHVEVVAGFQAKIRDAKRLSVITDRNPKDTSDSWAWLLDDALPMNPEHIPTKHSAMVDYGDKGGSSRPRRGSVTRVGS